MDVRPSPGEQATYQRPYHQPLVWTDLIREPRLLSDLQPPSSSECWDTGVSHHAQEEEHVSILADPEGIR